MNLDFSNLRILVYGDVMLDEYVHGVIERISPEAPVAVFSEERREYRAGGAANVAANVASLGVKLISLCGVVGDDEDAAKLRGAIPLGVCYNLVEAACRTTNKKRYLAQRGHYALRVDIDGDGRLVDEDKVVELINAQPYCDAIIVSDYAKGAVTKRAMDALRAKGVPIFVDPKAKDWSLYEGASWFTPNEQEWRDAKVAPLPQNVLITRGERGMTLSRLDDEDDVHCPAVAHQVADVTGAGDTVIAAFTSAIMSGNDPVESMRFANVCAGIAVSKSGTVTVSIAEARAAFDE